MALWGGRFEKGVDAFTQEFGASLEDDKAMAQEDIKGSRAHAKMLAKQGIISGDDAAAIDAGLEKISGEIANGTFAWDVNDEDVHMAVEKALTADIGTPGARLHTGRSRNDQVATDIRLYAKRLCAELLEGNVELRRTLLSVAEKNLGVVMPGYTHLQHAQPVLFSHHMLAYFWMFSRDYTRLVAARTAADANPLGSAALTGTTYPLDRDYTTRLLGFDHAIPNSMDAVSDRDYLLDLDYACAVSMMHLSRLCEEIDLRLRLGLGDLVGDGLAEVLLERGDEVDGVSPRGLERGGVNHVANVELRVVVRRHHDGAVEHLGLAFRSVKRHKDLVVTEVLVGLVCLCHGVLPCVRAGDNAHALPYGMVLPAWTPKRTKKARDVRPAPLNGNTLRNHVPTQPCPQTPRGRS